MAEEIIEEVPTVPAELEVIDLTGLEEKLTGLVEVLEAEQEQKKLEAEELAKQEEQAKLDAEEQAKIDAQTQKAQAEQQQADVATVEEFRANLLSELKTLNEEVQELKEIELQNQEMYAYTLPNVRQASDLSIIFLCLIPLFIVYKWLAGVFNGAFR